MFGLFHKSSDRPLSEKGLLGVLEYSQKSSRCIGQLADDNRVSANNLMTYGSVLGDDLTDVTSRLGHLLIQWSNILMEFQDSVDQYRDTLKSITVKEASLQPGRDQKRKLRDQIERLQNSLSSMDKVNNLKEQLAQLEEFTAPDEAEMSNFKRIATREGLYLLLNGMHAMSSKSDIISTFGKYIVDELDVDPVKAGEERRPYTGAEKTKRIQEDAQRAIEQWNPDKAKVRRTLTAHHGHNPLIVKQLPPVPPKEDAVVSPTPSATTSTKSDNTEEASVPPRHVSLEEQNKQYSFYKPDDVVEDEDEPRPSASTSTTTTHTTHGGGGFSSVYLHHSSPFQSQQQPFQPQQQLNQQNLYQFYQHYLPPRPYDEMKSIFSPGAVFRGEETKRHDAGGFVLPSTNPNYRPNPSTSSRSVSSSARSITSDGDKEDEA
ncbi:Eisosome component PIL1-domain-containing protein [Mucor lusitanicus]|uniref:Eisosome component PIL1-domain-containing protein n=2 Tax=Mucor circinelloides f. lusitanicus TaxID=29924 RepID=A0A8H4EXQ5_MUCCL|nr:Eisosome component PIL1-domain-containing protein [Mucor lusitanicus]